MSNWCGKLINLLDLPFFSAFRHTRNNPKLVKISRLRSALQFNQSIIYSPIKTVGDRKGRVSTRKYEHDDKNDVAIHGRSCICTTGAT